MNRKYKVAETTIIEREKIVNEALGISVLGSSEPTAGMKKLLNEYILGNMEISEILNITINRYKIKS